MRSVTGTVLLCLALVAVVLGMFVYSVTRPTLLSAEQLRERGVIILPRPREIAKFELVDTSGEAFTVEDLQGVWSFVFFGFTNCPDVCPTSMSVLAQAERVERINTYLLGLLSLPDPDLAGPDLLYLDAVERIAERIDVEFAED